MDEKSNTMIRFPSFFRMALSFMVMLMLLQCTGEAELERPNIIFIMADDLGYTELGSYGQTLIQTPSLDEMAREGLRFTSVYSGSQVCAPCRSVLMTGLHTGHTRVRQNSGSQGGDPDEMTGRGHRIPLEDGDFTVAEMLKEAGYVTGITGKWGLGEAGSSGEPNRQGFDEFYGFLNQNHAVFYYTDYLWRDGRRDSIPENRNGREEVYVHDLFTSNAIDFIRRHREEPFFLYLAYTIPHFNLEVPELEPYTLETDWSESQKILASMITRMDRDVGRIREELRRLELEENTLVFFTSDNGPAIGRRVPGRDSLFNSNSPFKGAKGDLDEGGIRVPMIVSWPGKVPAGKVSGQPWYFADIMPTLAEVSGSGVPENTDGISVLPLLEDETHVLPERYMYWENPRSKIDQTVRYGKWNIRRLGGEGEPIALYNLEEDPGQETDLASAHPDLVARFETYLKSARTDSPYWPLEK
jgi:arylsulfatase A-like enzyme